MEDINMEPRDLCRMKIVKAIGGYEGTASSLTEASCSSNQRLKNSPLFCYNEAYVQGKHSSGSLGASFETPYGVIRMPSPVQVGLARMDSGNSIDSFHRDISMYKLQAMPSLKEDGDSADDEDDEPYATSRKTKNRGKIKKSKGKANAKREQSEAQKHESAKEKNVNTTGCSDILKAIFTCGQSNNTKDEVNEHKMKNVSKNPTYDSDDHAFEKH